MNIAFCFAVDSLCLFCDINRNGGDLERDACKYIMLFLPWFAANLAWNWLMFCYQEKHIFIFYIIFISNREFVLIRDLSVNNSHWALEILKQIIKN